ncbi:MAG: acyl-CoA dehydrogenase C-terminal domain-containing protein [Alphaproteobacteria bacterium]|jgi:alkylation response protein AidB-like acyl-CoA dehydrogenase|nr:acyl-CoA dehydrogenase C-terminal domain-containing protein [Alphaproteobacteria bacterium]
MPVYHAPLREFRFLYKDVLGVERYANMQGFENASLDLIEQILAEGAKFATETLLPLNHAGDVEGCLWSPDGVKTPSGFREAYKTMVEGGWPALSSDPAFGGQGLPHVVNVAFNEMVTSTNMAFGMYPGLTHGAYSAIHVGGTEEQKRTYLPKMVSFEWAGTMNLTEPHCGTDLGLLRTKAVPQPDGSYKITGQKIWISGGEQDLTENIIHLVLARIEGAPAGVKGISLFIVPKYLVNPDGSLGARNNAFCVGLEEKMGIHGNATCVMQYEEATGYLIGEANKGLNLMFVMMNEARLGVGLQGLGMSEVAYQNAVAFAKDRRQGRSLTGPKEPDQPADSIIAHPDVRRMLMDAKCFNEGARAFLFWTALYGDLLHNSPDEKVREKAGDYMALMTPVLKAFLTGEGFRHISDAMQVHGGSGFTEHFPASQFLRDSRIAMIYEGTNGVQALDLVGRKLAANGGRAIFSFFNEIDAFIADHEGEAQMAPFIEGLKSAKGQLQEGTMWLMQNGMQNFDNAGAASHDYLQLFGLTALSYMWALMAKAALANKGADPFYDNKIVTGRYFLDRRLPEASAHLAKLKTGAEAMMALPVEAF